MGSRLLKDDEKNERSIRALLKQPENRKCINCGSVGPQYVCTTFSVFVCTNCSGLHREFSHRIKSVSMAKFTAEEVKNLQAGGNERGREIFLKDFDHQRNSLPDSSNPDKLRDFIKSVYVERRYTGERLLPPKGRQGDREDSYGRADPRPDPRASPRHDFRQNSRSPPFEDRHDDRRGVERRRSDVERTRYDDRTRYDERIVRFEERRSPARLETDPRSRYDRGQYDDRRHDDRSRYEERERDRRASYDDRFANESRHDRRRSADDRHFKEFDGDSPPVRPVSEILGDNIPALRVDEYSHTNGRDDDDRSSIGSPASTEQRKDMRIPRLGSFGSANGSSNSLSSVGNAVVNSAPIKRQSSGSLIDFSFDPEPAITAAAPTIDPFGVPAATAPQLSAVSSNSTGWAVFDLAPAAAVPTPAEMPPAGYPDVFPNSSNGGQWCASGWPSNPTPSTPTPDGWSTLVGSSSQTPIAPPNSQPWNSFSPPLSQPSVAQIQPGLQEQPNTSAGPLVAPVIDRSRELPKEIFPSSFPMSGMPTGGLGVRPQMQNFPPTASPYTSMGTMPGYAQPPRSRNPFDLPGDVAPSMGGGSFPNLGSLQAALPTGPLSVPGSVAPNMSNQWSVGPQPASYPQGGPTGGNVFPGQASSSFGPSSGMPVQSAGPSFGMSNSGNFNNMALFSGGPSHMGGLPDFSAQNSVRPVGGNPFG